MKVEKMSVSEWIGVLDNPRQRDTLRHADTAVKKHLKCLSPTHCRVSAAKLPGGTLVKLDGHTRAMLWKDGRLDQPSCVYVDVYHVDSMNEAKELYTHFDAQSAVENAKDKLAGAFRENGIEATSSLLRNGGMFSALRTIDQSKNTIYEKVTRWKRELIELDAFGFTHEQYNGGMVFGALALLRVRGSDRMADFLRGVAMNSGTKTEEGSDGIDAICRYVRELPKGTKGGEVRLRDIGCRFINAGEGYLKGTRYRTAIKPIDAIKYLVGK